MQYPNRLREKTYLKDSQGVAAIEFAFVAPMFFLVFLGIFEVASLLTVRASLETAVLQVSRFGRTGDTVSGQTPQETAVVLAKKYSFGLIDESKLTLTVTPYPSFSAIPSLSNVPNDGTQNFGTGKQPVLYTLSYQWEFYTPLVGKLLAEDGKSITIMASTVVENEPS